MRLVTTKIIDKWLSYKNDIQKIEFLEKIEEEIFELFNAWEITETDRDNLDFYIISKAKEILKPKK